jgi:putative flippase GtrA
MGTTAAAAAMARGEMRSHMEGGRLYRTRAQGLGVVSRTWAGSLRARRFAAVGVVNTLLDYVLFIALTKIFSLPLSLVWIAKLVSGTVAIANSFYLNRRWVFRAGGARLAQAARFVAATVIGVYVIQTSLTHVFATSYPGVGTALYDVIENVGLADAFPGILTEALAIKTAAFVIATSASMTFNFLAYRFWVFRPSSAAP